MKAAQLAYEAFAPEGVEWGALIPSARARWARVAEAVRREVVAELLEVQRQRAEREGGGW